MVYEEDTKRLCHELAEDCKAAYHELIAKEADRMLVESEHKFLAFIVRLLDLVGFDQSFIQRRYDKFLQEMAEDRQ